jgi:hypothetical protein
MGIAPAQTWDLQLRASAALEGVPSLFLVQDIDMGMIRSCAVIKLSV